MKTLASLTLAPARTPSASPRWRWAALSLALAAAPLAQAQTLIETITTTNVSNTLDATQTTNALPGLDRAKAAQQTQNAQTQKTNAASATDPVTGKAAAPLLPFNTAQSARLNTARTLLSQGNARGARPIYEGLIAANYQQPEPHFGLALSLLALNDLTGARFELTQFVALSPASFEGPYNLGVIAARTKDYDEALKQFTAAVALPNTAAPAARRQLLEALAGEQLRRGDYAGLSATLTQALATDPQDLSLRYRLGQATAYAGKGAEALPLLYAAAQSDVNRAGATLLIADIYAAQNLPDRGVRELDTAAALVGSADRARLLVRKAQLLQAQDQTPAATQAAREAVQADSKSAPAYAVLGTLLAQSDLKGSLAAWQMAAQLDAQNGGTLLNLAAVQLSLGMNTEALSNAARALKLIAATDTASLARTEFVQGVSAYRLKDYSAAVKALSSSAARTPGAQTSLWLGLSHYARKDYEAAVAALIESVKLGDSAAARLNLGAALLATGRFSEAEPNLRSVVVTDPRNAAAWYQLGLSRKAQGKDSEAKTAFASAAKLGYAPAKAELK
jgi:tetratricopeptide (TPR) repeat protein